MKSFTFISRLVLFEKLLHVTNGLFEALQARGVDLAAATEPVSATTDSLEEYRSESVWNGVWEGSLSCATANDNATDENPSLFTR